MRTRLRRSDAIRHHDAPLPSKPSTEPSPDDMDTGILAIVPMPPAQIGSAGIGDAGIRDVGIGDAGIGEDQDATVRIARPEDVDLDGSDSETLVLNGVVVGRSASPDEETLVLQRMAAGTAAGHAGGEPARKPRKKPRATPLVSSGRRSWISRGALLAILLIQAALTLRMQNTAFEDEAQYLYAGHMELAHWINGAPLYGSFSSYFSGTPVLYPVLGAACDTWGGLFGARLASLVFMLTTTSLLYSMTRRLFNERVGLCAAALFSVTESALFLGDLATFDAPALCLLAFAAWIVVRTAHMRYPWYLLAAPVVALAGATKYAALLFLPTIALLAALAAVPYWGARWVWLRTVLLLAVVGGLLAGALDLAGSAYAHGVESTTTARAHGTTSITQILHESALWGGWVFAVAVVGVVFYVRKAQTEEGEEVAPSSGRRGRLALGVVLAASALLAPLYQIHLHTDISLQKHVGFGLLFAAPPAGVGMARLVGDHFRRPQVGIAVWAIALIFGMTQANTLFGIWPNSTLLVAEVRSRLSPGATYLVETDEVPIYYLMSYPDAQPDQFTSTYTITYTDKQGQTLGGTPGFEAAIRDDYFKVVAYDDGATAALDAVLAADLSANPAYHLAAVLPQATSGGRSAYYVWVRE